MDLNAKNPKDWKPGDTLVHIQNGRKVMFVKHGADDGLPDGFISDSGPATYYYWKRIQKAKR